MSPIKALSTEMLKILPSLLFTINLLGEDNLEDLVATTKAVVRLNELISINFKRLIGKDKSLCSKIPNTSKNNTQYTLDILL